MGFGIFCFDTDSIPLEKLSEFEDEENLIRRVSQLSIEGVSLKDIFDKEINLSSIYIL